MYYAIKSLGQHFLRDRVLLRQIVQAAGSLENTEVLEIGPGYGDLTKELIAANPGKLIALEKDQSFADHYRDNFADHENLFVFGDALEVDERTLFTGPIKVVANLPYNISSQLIFKWLQYIEFFQLITVMLQKEFALRLCASPSTKSYGRLSILLQVVCDVDYQFTVGPEHFTPPPKVDSAVINIKPLPQPRFPYDAHYLADFTKFAFNLRRKQLQGTLRRYLHDYDKAAEVIRLSGIDPADRPDGITVEQHCRISLALRAQQASF
jgi:16S rRNA (adenine1518-N6/adenine1519-N6)-dimethyltransferase